MASLKEYLLRVMSQLLEDEMKLIYGSIWYFSLSVSLPRCLFVSLSLSVFLFLNYSPSPPIDIV